MLAKLNSILPPHVVAELQGLNITSNLELAHFLAQCDHESTGFKYTVENLNYSADRLKEVFPKYLKGKLVEFYARNPERTGNLVYASRIGNGDEKSGDGYKYRGRGYIQLTGRSNYTEFAKYMKDMSIVDNPDLVSTKYALVSAYWFWTKNGINTIAKKGSSQDVINEVTRKVNGGLIGIQHRTEMFKKYYGILK